MPGKKATVIYDAKAGPFSNLDESTSLVLHWGYNAWSAKGFTQALEGPLENKGSAKSSQCYSATILVPQDAAVLDFVVQSSTGVYDNAGGLDYHVAVDRKEGLDAFWDSQISKEKEKEEAFRKEKRERLRASKLQSVRSDGGRKSSSGGAERGT